MHLISHKILSVVAFLLTLSGFLLTLPGVQAQVALSKTEQSGSAASAGSLAVDNHSIDMDWNEFRGGDRQSISPLTGLPLRWNLQKNIAWKKPIEGFGLSSPVIVGHRLWVTTALEKDKTLHLICLHADTGEILWDLKAFQKESLRKIHGKNSHATPTPLVYGDRCIAHFGSHGTIATDLEGRVLWRTEIPYYHHHGPGSSPVLVDDTLIIACDGHSESFYDDHVIAGVKEAQFVVGLDVATGKERWRNARDGQHSYATPLVIEVEGQKQVICPGGNGIIAYHPESGEELWSYQTKGYSVVPRPVFGHGLVFVCTGYDEPELVAIRPPAKGPLSDSHVEWKSTQAVPLNPTPILLGNQLYTISDSGVLSCLEATTGKLTWRRRLGGNYSASPVFADGRLYFLNEAGETTVVEPGNKYQFLAKNPLRGTTLASISIARHALFIRTDTELFRVEQLSRNDDPETGSSDTGESVAVPPATKVIQPPTSAPGIRLRGRKTPTETPQAPNP